MEPQPRSLGCLVCVCVCVCVAVFVFCCSCRVRTICFRVSSSRSQTGVHADGRQARCLVYNRHGRMDRLRRKTPGCSFVLLYLLPFVGVGVGIGWWFRSRTTAILPGVAAAVGACVFGWQSVSVQNRVVAVPAGSKDGLFSLGQPELFPSISSVEAVLGRRFFHGDGFFPIDDTSILRCRRSNNTNRGCCCRCCRRGCPAGRFEN